MNKIENILTDSIKELIKHSSSDKIINKLKATHQKKSAFYSV